MSFTYTFYIGVCHLFTLSILIYVVYLYFLYCCMSFTYTFYIGVCRRATKSVTSTLVEDKQDEDDDDGSNDHSTHK